jgi:hypothetical protein
VPARPDHSSKDGAHKLAREIERYWREKGSTKIEAWVEPGAKIDGNQSTSHNARFDVRTNLVNGLPPDFI